MQRRHLVVISALFLSASATGCVLHRAHSMQPHAVQSLTPGTELVVSFITARSVALTGDDGTQSSLEGIVKLRARFQQLAGDTIVLRVTTGRRVGSHAPVVSESRLVLDSTVFLQRFRVDPVTTVAANLGIVVGAAALVFMIALSAAVSGECYC